MLALKEIYLVLFFFSFVDQINEILEILFFFFDKKNLNFDLSFDFLWKNEILEILD